MELLREKSTPPILASLLDRLRESAPDDYAQLEEDVKLSYHFDGCYVAYRKTSHGIEILASGSAVEVQTQLTQQSIVGTEALPISIRTPKSFKELYLTLRLGIDGGMESGTVRS